MKQIVLAVAFVAACPLVAQAQLSTVSLSLNLRYTDPADPSEGGRWYLLAKDNATPSNEGLAALDVYLANIDTTGIVFGNNGVNSDNSNRGYNAVTAADIGAEVTTPDGGPFAGLVDGFAHITYAQDNSLGAPTPLKLDVAHGALTPGSIPLDPLRGTIRFGGTVSTPWNEAALIASGTFPGGGDASNQFNRPAFVTPPSAIPSASVLTSATLGSPLASANLATTVRGDSLAELALNAPSTWGLRRGDADRDFDVDSDDLKRPLLFWKVTGNTWDRGDFTDGLPGHVEGTIDSDDLNWVLLFFNTSHSPPLASATGGAVPEPATAGFAVLLPVLATFARRRKR
jgi:hypothetical protein